MSFFGTGSRPSTSNSSFQPNNEKLEAASLEVEMVADLFNRLVSSCWTKCIVQNKFPSGELEKGEAACVDRCVSKYFQANELVGKKMQEANSGGGGGSVGGGGGLF
jgi:mitochondrial import inner membrane translocase subunit TIM10